MERKPSISRKRKYEKQDLALEKIKKLNLKAVMACQKAFVAGNTQPMLTYLANDAVYEIPGPKDSAYSRLFKGKKNIAAFYQKRDKMRSKFIKKFSMKSKFTVSKDFVIDEWTMMGIEAITNKKFSAQGINYFRMHNGMIKGLRIFINAPLSSQVKSLDEKRLQVSDQGKLALMAWSVV